MYPTAVIRVFWSRDSLRVADRFWLHCNISNTLWTLDVVYRVLSYSSFFISESFSVFVLSNFRTVPAKIPLLVKANCLTTTVLRVVSPVAFDCFLPITTWQREHLASTPSPYDMIGNMSCATLERSAYFECVSSCWHHQSVMSGIQNVLTNYI
jgi:hypothetical protein